MEVRFYPIFQGWGGGCTATFAGVGEEVIQIYAHIAEWGYSIGVGCLIGSSWQIV